MLSQERKVPELCLESPLAPGKSQLPLSSPALLCTKGIGTIQLREPPGTPLSLAHDLTFAWEKHSRKLILVVLPFHHYFMFITAPRRCA
jgi:hypothetical protein